MVVINSADNARAKPWRGYPVNLSLDINGKLRFFVDFCGEENPFHPTLHSLNRNFWQRM
jgi:hypothetical protein